MTARIVLVAAAALSLVGAACPLPGDAATLAVTTRRDVVADDGFCSLREAVASANTQQPSGSSPGECPAGDPLPTVDVIRLARGRYRLSLGFPGDDANLGGDLDVTESVVIEGAGRTKTTLQNDIGNRKVLGDGDRLLHVDPSAAGGVDLVLRGLTVADGDVSCAGADCAAGASAVEVSGDGDLALDDCGVRRNASSCLGPQCGSSEHTAAIRVHGGAVTLRQVFVEDNHASCDSDFCTSGAAALLVLPAAGLPSAGPLVVEGVRLAGNTATCAGQQCRVEHVLLSHATTATLVDAVVARNETRCTGVDCRVQEAVRFELGTLGLTLEGVALEKNAASCTGEICVTDALLKVAGGDITARDLVLASNRVACDGVECIVRDMIDLSPTEGTASLTGVEIARNEVSCVAEKCNTDNLVQAFVGNATTLRDVVIAKNRLSCEGAFCDTDQLFQVIAAVATVTGGMPTGSVTGEGIRFVQNRASCEGERCDVDPALMLLSDGFIQVAGLEAAANQVQCAGFDCDLDELMVIRGTTVTALDLAVERNRARCDGDSCDVENALSVFGDAASLVQGARFVDNRAECAGTDCTARNGGALENGCDGLVVRDALFAGNRTDGDGGAIVNQANGSGARLDLIDVELRDNRAGGRGGAIANRQQSGGQAILATNGVTIRKNRAAVDGGGIWNEGLIQALVDTTFFANQPNDCVNASVSATGCP